MRNLVFLFCLMACVVPMTKAGGLSITEMSASGIGASNALTANVRDVGAIPYNPSLGALHAQNILSAHLMGIRFNTAVTPDSGSYTEHAGHNEILVPGLSINLPFAERHAFVLNVNSPFAVQTKWPVGTFPDAASHMGGLAQPTESKLEVIRTSSSIATKLSENSSFALGIDYYLASTIIFDAVARQNKLDGDGWGLNASFTHKITPQLTFGADYHSMGFIDARGKTTTLEGHSYPARIHKTPLPWRLQMGLAWDTRPDLTFEFDYTRTGWDNYKTIEIESQSPTLSQNYWSTNDAYRLGMEYRMNDRLRLRAGYSYDEAVQGDNYFSARSPDSDRHLFGMGLGYDLAEDVTLDVGYMYVKFEDRAITSSVVPTTAELNGTSAYNGLYETDAHILGLSLSKKF